MPCPCLRTPLLPAAEPQRCDQRALRHRPQARDAAGAGCPPHLHHCLSHPPQPEGLPQECGVSPPPCPQASTQPFFVVPSLCPCVTAMFWGTNMRCCERPPGWVVAQGLGSSDSHPLVPPWGCVRPPHTDMQQPGLGTFAASPGSFPREPGLIFCLHPRQGEGSVAVSSQPVTKHWLSPPLAPRGPKPIPSLSVQLALPNWHREEGERDHPERTPEEVWEFALSLHEGEWEPGSAAEHGTAAPQAEAGSCVTSLVTSQLCPHPLGDPSWGLLLPGLWCQGSAGVSPAPLKEEDALGQFSVPLCSLAVSPAWWLMQASLPTGRSGAWSPSCPPRSCSSSKRRASGNPSRSSSRPTSTSLAAPR